MVPTWQVLRCPSLRYGADLSGLAMSGLAISAPPGKPLVAQKLQNITIIIIIIIIIIM